MYPAQSGSHQPMFQASGWMQASAVHGGQTHGPPPAKKQKGNCIITRYPPPPGYSGPAQSQQPYAQPLWQQPPYTVQQRPTYAIPQSHAWSYTPQQPLQVGFPYSPACFLPTPSYSPQSQPQTQNPHSWQAPRPLPTKGQRRASTHSRRPSSVHSGPLDGNGEPLPPCSEADDDDSLEADYAGECYFARHPDEINPDLSLGQIEWHAPLPTRWALPSTFAEAELEALAPRKTPPPGEESISEYFKPKRRDEAFLSVRQTDIWNDIKDDFIFRELPRNCTKLLGSSELSSLYRARPNPTADVARLGQFSPTSQTQAPTDVEMYESDTGWNSDWVNGYKNNNLASSQQCTAGGESAVGNGRSKRASSSASSFDGSRSRSPAKLNRPKPLAPIRDQAQEDILAMLGVTGSPKMVYQTPGPAFGPPPEPARHSARSQHNSVASTRSTNHEQARPTLMPGGEESTKQISRQNLSQQTPASSRFVKMDSDNDATPRACSSGIDGSRKRSFQASEDRSVDEDSDTTPRQRHKQQRRGPPR